MVESKSPYHTQTGRQQFYVDHPWFLELGEALPVHKDPPAAGGNHPLVMTGGHTRWSIHAQWRDSELMLRLQRGEPTVHLNPDDARGRGISDHDWIRVRNDLGSFRARARVIPGIRPGQAHIFHAWEPYSRFELTPQLMSGYHGEALDRTMSLLNELRRSPVLFEDPNGNAAFAYVRDHRRDLRRLKRRGLPRDRRIHEAAASHAPAAGSHAARALVSV